VLALAALRGPEASGISLGGDGSTGGVRRGTEAAATSSPLYRTGRLTPVSCRVPAIEDGDPDSMKRFLDVLSDCLDQSWRTQMGKARLPHTAPKRVFWNAPGTSPCGSYPASGAAAFYCPANSTMYIGLQHVVQTAGNEPVSHYAVYARVVAHEYGHHVQEKSGILAYGYGEMEEAAPGDRLEISRRIELQAQCLAGAFLGAERDTLPMTPQQYRNMIDDVRGRGDDRLPPDQRDHGSGRHYAGWVARGYREQTLTTCNTWIAEPQAVS
jgi:uncharacterized protein